MLMEAMSHGLPVISSDLPVCQEIMGDFGLYFRCGDSHGLAEQMTRSITLDWQELSKEALSIAERFNIKNIISLWRDIIKSN